MGSPFDIKDYNVGRLRWSGRTGPCGFPRSGRSARDAYRLPLFIIIIPLFGKAQTSRGKIFLRRTSRRSLPVRVERRGFLAHPLSPLIGEMSRSERGVLTLSASLRSATFPTRDSKGAHLAPLIGELRPQGGEGFSAASGVPLRRGRDFLRASRSKASATPRANSTSSSSTRLLRHKKGTPKRVPSWRRRRDSNSCYLSQVLLP